MPQRSLLNHLKSVSLFKPKSINVEEKVMDMTAELWNYYVKNLEQQHPSEFTDLADAIHQIQALIALRIARKYHPEIFSIKK